MLSAPDDIATFYPNHVLIMLTASVPPAMEAYRVSRAVNTPRQNREELLLPVA